MKYNIVILGLGMLGKRHLSSILESALRLDVYCYDINENAMEGFVWNDKHNNKILTIVHAIEDLPSKIDFALFAMTANVRREMFDRLISSCKVKNILFEKVLFQCIDDYFYVGDKIKTLGIHAWINCSRRQMDSYQELKKELKKADDMNITISGGEWGLACNAIHELDLVEFLSGSTSTVVEKMNLLPTIVDSKRKGFKEIYGYIEGYSGKCEHFFIKCMKDTEVPEIVHISTNIGQYIILEDKQKMIFFTEDNDYKLKEEDFFIPYQSQMTQFVMEDILIRGKSRLVDFHTSSRLHLEILKPMLRFFKEHGMEGESCPIT